MTSLEKKTETKLTLDVKELGGKTNGTVDLPATIFDAPANIALLHQVVVAQLAAARQGTHSTKTRGEVRGGGKKPYRQKGTGRARQGSTRAPQFVGGGTVHGPQPRDYSQRTPKKMKAAALRGALSDRARSERIHVITELVAGQVPSTKGAKTFLAEISDRKKVLLVVGREDTPRVDLGRHEILDQLRAHDGPTEFDFPTSERGAGPAVGKRQRTQPVGDRLVRSGKELGF